jgi:hypothetical protein
MLAFEVAGSVSAVGFVGMHVIGTAVVPPAVTETPVAVPTTVGVVVEVDVL